MKHRFVIPAIILCFQVCAPALPSPPSHAPIEVLSGIIYKRVDGRSLRLDLYRPVHRRGPLPVTVFLHGGGWMIGDKTDVTREYRGALLRGLLDRGYAVASVQYRLCDAGNVHFPAPLEDCGDAVRWLRRHAVEYGLDPDNIGLWGSSAGAHLALMTAYAQEGEFPGSAELRGISPKVNYVVNNFGPTDLERLFRPETGDLLLWALRLWNREAHDLRRLRLSSITGLDLRRRRDEVIGLCRRYSPVNHVRGGVATITFHGDGDRTVPLEQAKLLDDALRQHGIRHELVICRGEGHGLRGLGREKVDDLVRRTVAFIDESRTH
ncbi:MAG: alpha/beta hydrolase [Spirochaetes bacterium]|nr:alpha/beta hydrolase [Spirochaetota bacterium]